MNGTKGTVEFEKMFANWSLLGMVGTLYENNFKMMGSVVLEKAARCTKTTSESLNLKLTIVRS